MTVKEHLNNVLDVNSEIKFNDAKILLKDKYKVDLSRSNFDKIKCDKRNNKKNKISKKKKKSGQNLERKNLPAKKNAVTVLTVENLIIFHKKIKIVRS